MSADIGEHVTLGGKSFRLEPAEDGPYITIGGKTFRLVPSHFSGPRRKATPPDPRPGLAADGPTAPAHRDRRMPPEMRAARTLARRRFRAAQDDELIRPLAAAHPGLTRAELRARLRPEVPISARRVGQSVDRLAAAGLIECAATPIGRPRRNPEETRPVRLPRRAAATSDGMTWLQRRSARREAARRRKAEEKQLEAEAAAAERRRAAAMLAEAQAARRAEEQAAREKLKADADRTRHLREVATARSRRAEEIRAPAERDARAIAQAPEAAATRALIDVGKVGHLVGCPRDDDRHPWEPTPRALPPTAACAVAENARVVRGYLEEFRRIRRRHRREAAARPALAASVIDNHAQPDGDGR